MTDHRPPARFRASGAHQEPAPEPYGPGGFTLRV